MGKSAEELRAEAAYQREQLSETVDAIGDRVSPGRIMERRTNRVKDGLGRARESVIGRADSTAHSLTGTAGGLGSTASDAGSAVAGLPSTAAHGMTSTAQGNPLMAGAVAFGAGLLAAAIFPGTKAEGKAAAKLKDAAQPLVEQAKEIGQEAAQHLQEPAQQAVANVKDVAAEGAAHVQDTAKSAAADTTEAGTAAVDEVKSTAQDAKAQVKDAAPGSGSSLT